MQNLATGAAPRKRISGTESSYHTACHVHFLWLAAELTAHAAFWQLHPLRCIHAPHLRRQNAYATLALSTRGNSSQISRPHPVKSRRSPLRPKSEGRTLLPFHALRLYQEVSDRFEIGV